MTYVLTLLLLFVVSALLALSANVLIGYCGLLTMAHAGYFALGAYTYALLTVSFGYDWLIIAPAAALVGGVASLAISIPSWRFRGDYFIIMSLAAQNVLYSFFNNFYEAGHPLGSWPNLTNGPAGIAGIGHPRVASRAIESIPAITALAVVVAVIVLFLLRRLLVSPWGRMLVAMRDDELALRSLGKDVRVAKLTAVATACALAAVAGTIHAAYFSYVDPTLASLDRSILLLSMVMIGGTANFTGPVIGAGLLVLFPEVLRALRVSGPNIGHVQLATYGVLLLLFIHFRPQGIAGRYRLE